MTTFAVVAGVIGADLSTRTVLILGAANLLADGFSMAASNYSGTKSECDDQAGLSTFLAFLLCGSVPLLPFVMGTPPAFALSVVLTGIVFFGIGSVKSRWSLASWWRSGLETLAIGMTAAAIAFAVGWVLGQVTGMPGVA